MMRSVILCVMLAVGYHQASDTRPLVPYADDGDHRGEEPRAGALEPDEPFNVCVAAVENTIMQRYPNTPWSTARVIAEANCLDRPDSGI